VPQVFPHVPQLEVLVDVSTQVPLHAVIPLPHVQTLAMHVCPVPQVLPHVPQLEALVEVSTQVPPHAVMPLPHVQTLATQLCPVPQVLPHTPQFMLSVATLVHWPPQLTCPVGQLGPASPASLPDGVPSVPPSAVVPDGTTRLVTQFLRQAI
jgi:hypothetical protein